jgi:hypothetical protein
MPASETTPTVLIISAATSKNLPILVLDLIMSTSPSLKRFVEIV